LPPVPDGTDFYATTGIADYAIGFLKEHAKEHAGQPFLSYLAFTSPHFPLQARAEDIARYHDHYREGWDLFRAARFRRMRALGIVDCALSEPDPKTAPFWNLSEDLLRKRIGPGEVGYAVPWNNLSQPQMDFQAVKMSIHAAMIDRMDREIGRVLDQVIAMGAWENTCIIFVSDNGASAEQLIRSDGHDPAAPPGSAKTFLCLGPGWATVANTPLRLHKSWVHEGGIASPAIIHWPAGIHDRGQLRHTAGHFIDLVPTLLELAGGHSPGAWHGATPPPLPGRSLAAVLHKDVAIPRPYLWWHHMNNRAIRVGDWKLVAAGSKQAFGPWELYNLRADRSEANDLAAGNPAMVHQLDKLWQNCEDQFQRDAGPQVTGGEKSKRAPQIPKPAR
jgi:arylsulfatase